MEIKAVLFDMDGVLIDSEVHYVTGTYELMKTEGFTGTFEDVAAIVGTTMKETYEMVNQMLGNKYSYAEMKKRYDAWFIEHPLPYASLAKPGALACIKNLKRQHILTAVCSASPVDNIAHVMEVCGFGQHMDFVVSGEELKRSKPFPDIYLHAADVLKVKPNQCVVVEDSLQGIEAGKAAGMLTVAMRDRRLFQDRQEKEVPFVFDTFEQLEQWLIEQGNDTIEPGKRDHGRSY